MEQKIYQVFEDVKMNGFDTGRVEAAIHQIEIGIKHVRAQHC